MTQLERLAALLVEELDSFSNDINKLQATRNYINNDLQALEVENYRLRELKEQIKAIHISPDLTELKRFEQYTEQVSQKFSKEIMSTTKTQLEVFQRTGKKKYLFYRTLIVLLLISLITGTGFGLFKYSEISKKYTAESQQFSTFKTNLGEFFQSDKKAYKSFINWKKEKFE